MFYSPSGVRETRNKETAYLAVCIVGQLKPSRQEQIWRQLDRIWVLGILIRFLG